MAGLQACNFNIFVSQRKKEAEVLEGGGRAEHGSKWRGDPEREEWRPRAVRKEDQSLELFGPPSSESPPSPVLLALQFFLAL